ncbi:hypothetical protein [Chryseobacterium luteum]|uniref:Uncharacterized protein n=1 Tax=Chryseobacterium luteum TaxID=421531 RepID=A0A085ZAI1_9FLAO|nr:hypothetical protein [Chryseobacterium luteum]KFF01445.1 hypothetical protein IX38_17805 [Chryseobacterium luteum]
MKMYNGFIFFKIYNLEDNIPLMCDELINQFNIKAGIDGFFDHKAFTMLIGAADQEIYEKDGYFFLDCEIVFPTSQAFDCTICWQKQDNGSLKFYWTTNFPDEELSDYINGRGLPDDLG